ncbi:HLA class II histocompatibility antigen, DR alpha chain [Thamnophis elegans]|uniref:HLA class II histocompatibility antigen, DR alpha chain n=1 Tax=Thamnophis elegans TaxID=35005 RepID=UPI0013788CD3|nr:HLA class II histocompatibility antigen, DR alpha chain [Thamnophis elegans]
MAGQGNEAGGPLGLARLLLLFLALAELGRAQDIPSTPGEEILSQVAFVQKTRRNTSSSSEFMFEFNDDEIFHVDLEERQTIWRLPEFGRFTSFQAEGAQGNIAVLQSNLEILMKRSNYTPATTPPKLMVYTERTVEMEEPNILICMADNFSPPVLNMTWAKNGQPVTEGVQTMDYYPKKDHAFRRFSYLPFVPNEEDIYSCEVEHWGLQKPLGKIWHANIPQPLQETTETVVCAVGLAIGLVGIVVGTGLMIKSRRMGEASYRRGNL